MSALSSFLRRTGPLADYAFKTALGRPSLDRPVFLTGCGRSGTTILGDVLGNHPSVVYLHEPLDIWFRCYPETDVWTPEAARRHGRLYLDDHACRPYRSAVLRMLFYRETVRRRRPRLVEKLPVNNFRLRFLHAIFPEALFLHLVRNGIEVARSIERRAANDDWWGAGDYKWTQLAGYARRQERYRDLPALCHSHFERGLLEWRVSVETALDFYETLPARKHLQVTYEALLDRPAEVLGRIEAFMGLPCSGEVRAFATANLERKSPRAPRTPPPGNARAIAGALAARLGYME